MEENGHWNSNIIILFFLDGWLLEKKLYVNDPLRIFVFNSRHVTLTFWGFTKAFFHANCSAS